MKTVWIMNHYAISHFYEKGGRHFWMAVELQKKGYLPIVFGCNEMHNSNAQMYPCNSLWHEEVSEDGIKFIPIRSTPYMGNGVSRVINMAIFAKNLKKAAKEYAVKYGKPDIIYASSVHPLTIVAGELLAKYFEVPCIGEVRDLWPETLVAYGSIKEKTLIAKLLYAGEKWIYKKADAMVFTMEGASQYIQEHKWDCAHGGPINLEKVYHICNGVDIAQFDANKALYKLPDADLDNPEIFCAVYTGAIKRANNVGLLLDTMKYLKDINNLKILIWGEGNEVDTLKQRVSDENLCGKVVFKGQVEKKYIASIVSRSDLNLMHWERTSVNNYGYDYNKLFEYLAAGKPIFSTIQSGHSLLINKKCGVETQGRNPKDFAEGIRWFYNMPLEKRCRWGDCARRAAQDYDFSVLTEKLIDIIESL